MASQLVLGVLKSTLGKYLELSDTEISVGAEIHLRNVKLKESVLADFGLPVKIVHGKVSRLVIKIPWFNLFTEPTTIELDGLHLLIAPASSVHYNEASEKIQAKEAKNKRLERAEQVKRLEEQSVTTPPSSESFLERLKVKIIGNLEMFITSIHIRYEDNQQMTTGGSPFSIGITLERIQMKTVFPEGKEETNTKQFEKELTIENLGFYWCSKSLLFISKIKGKEITSDVIDSLFNKSIGSSSLKYILEPLSSSAKLNWCFNPSSHHFTIPQMDLFIGLNELHFSLNKSQYVDIMFLLQSIEYQNRSFPFRRLKARHELENLVSYKGHYKSLWKFAFDAIFEETILRRQKNWSWSHMKEHTSLRKAYRSLYISKLLNGDENEELSRMEDKLDEINIRLERELAEREAKSIIKEKKSQKGGGGWFSGWWSSSSSTPTPTTLESIASSLSTEEKEKLFEVLEYQENSHHGTEYPKDYIEKQLYFSLKHLKITILNDDNNDEGKKHKKILNFSLRDVESHLHQRPSSNNIKFTMKMQNLTVTGDSENLYLVETKKEQTSTPLFILNLETNPLGTSFKRRIHFSSSPLEITFDSSTLTQLSLVFRTPEAINIQNLQQQAFDFIQEYRESSTLSLQYVNDNLERIDVNILFHASRIFLPHGGKFGAHVPIAVLDLGQISIKSQNEVDLSHEIRESSRRDALKQSVYYKFNISLDHLQMLIALPKEDWRSSLRETSVSPLHLLVPVSLKVFFESSALKHDSQLPLFKIRGTLNSFDVRIADYRLVTLIKILDSLLDSSSKEEIPCSTRSDSESSSMVSALSCLSLTSIGKKEDSNKLKKTPLITEVMNRVIWTMNLCIGELNVRLTQKLTSSTTDHDIFLFTTKELSACISVETFKTKGQFIIGGIVCQHCEKAVTMIETGFERNQKMLVINYTEVNEKSPEFSSLYESILRHIDIEFNSVKFVLHQDALLDLRNKIQSLTNEIQTEAKNIGVTLETTELEETQASVVSSSFWPPNTHFEESLEKKNSITEFKVEAVFHLVSFDFLMTSRILLSTVTIQDLRVSFLQNDFEKSFSAQLIDFTVFDQDEGTQYPIIAESLDSKVFDAHLRCFAKSPETTTTTEEKETKDFVDMSLSVFGGRVKIVFLMKFIKDFLVFLEPFSSGKEASEALKEASKQMNNVYASSSTLQIDLNIHLDAPLIIFPHSSTSQRTFMADLGKLSVVCSGNDIYKCELTDLKVWRCESHDSVSFSKGNTKTSTSIFTNEENAQSLSYIIHPLSFEFQVRLQQKNSSFLFLTGTLYQIIIELSVEDYRNALELLELNLSEKSSLTSLPSTSLTLPVSSNYEPLPLVPLEKKETLEEENTGPSVAFDFKFHGLSVKLFRGKGRSRPLSYLSAQVLYMTGRLSDKPAFEAHIYCKDFVLEDSRRSLQKEEKKKGIVKLLEMKKTDSNGLESDVNMIEISYKRDEMSSVEIDVTIHSFVLVVSISYFLQIAKFFVIPPEKHAKNTSCKKPTTTRNLSSSSTSFQRDRKQEESEVPIKTTLTLSMEQPDIYLVENIQEENSGALLLNTELQGKITTISSPNESVSILAFLTDIKCFTTSFGGSRKSQILSPTTLSWSLSRNEGHGNRVNINISEILLNVSPKSLRSIYSAVFASTSLYDDDDEENDDEENVSNTSKSLSSVKTEEDYSHLWEMRPLALSSSSSSFWFLQNSSPQSSFEATEDAFQSSSASPYFDEEAIFDINKFVVILEEFDGGQITVPLLLFEGSLNGNVENWSGDRMKAHCSLSLEIAYYNIKVACWEPVVEPIKHTGKSFERWSLEIEVQNSGPMDVNSALESPNYDDTTDGFLASENLPPLKSISLISQNMMEISITKNFLGILNRLTSSVLSFETLRCSESTSPARVPFLIQNRLGLNVTIALDSGFQYYYPYGSSSSQGLCFVDLKSFEDLELEVNPRLSKLLSPLQEQVKHDAASIKIKVSGYKEYFSLPISKASTHYFPFPFKGDDRGDIKAFVSSIRVENGCKIVTLSSKLRFMNYYSRSLEIFSDHGESSIRKIGIVQPNELFYVPIHDVYSPTYLFALRIHEEGQQIGIDFINWKTLRKREEEEKEEKDQVVLFSKGNISLNVSCSKVKLNEFGVKGELLTLSISPLFVFQNMLPVPLSIISDTLQPGESLPLHGVSLNESLSLTLPTHYSSTASCILEAFHESTVIPLEFKGDDSFLLYLNLVCRKEKGKGFNYALFSPFWMINLTGQDLSYKGTTTPSSIFYHSSSSQIPLMFSYTGKSCLFKNQCILRMNGGSWSEPFTLEAVKDSGKVQLNHKKDTIGIKLSLSLTGLTKIITFTPYYMIYNSSETYFFEVTDEVIENNILWTSISPKELRPLWPKTKVMSVRLLGSNSFSTFSIEISHSSLLAMKGQVIGGLFVQVKISESETLITLTPYKKGFAPVQLVNHTERTLIEYSEVGLETNSNYPCILSPQQYCYFTWSDPKGSRLLEWWPKNSREKIINSLLSDEKGCLSISNNEGREENLYWVSFLDGMQRVLLFSHDGNLVYGLAHVTSEWERIEREIEVSIHSIGISFISYSSVELLYLTISSSDVIWEVRKSGKTRYKPLNKYECEGIENDFQSFIQERSLGKDVPVRSVVGKMTLNYVEEKILTPIEGKLRRQFQRGLWFIIRSSQHQNQIHGKVNQIQIDNQLSECVFPVLFAHVPPPKSVISDSLPKPFLEFSLLEYRSPETTMLRQYKYVHLLIQECHIKIDLGLIIEINDLFAQETKTQEYKMNHLNFEEDLSVSQKTLGSLYIVDSRREEEEESSKNFYDYLHFSPLKVHVSYSSTLYGNGVQKSNNNDFLSLILQSPGVTLTDADDIVFRLAYFERTHSFYTSRDLLSEIFRHYSTQAIKQFYVVLLGFDVIGNPYGLVVSLGRSVEDLFYEPFQGAVEGPSEFAEGLVIGVRSVFSGVVGGAAGTVSRITGAIGKGLASLTFDTKYQNKRREGIKKRVQQNFGESLARGGKGVLTGLIDGVTGIGRKPYEGARDEGLGGLCKGVGKGVMGLVARPTVGLIDFASGTFESVKRLTDVTHELSRLRPARFFQRDGVLRYYDRREALGNKLLGDLDKGAYAKTDSYVTHEELHNDDHSILLLTDKRILLIEYNTVLGSWKNSWSFLYSEIEGPPSVEEETSGIYTIIIMPKEEEGNSTSKGVFRLFGGSSHKGKKVNCKSREGARNLSRVIEHYRTLN